MGTTGDGLGLAASLCLDAVNVSHGRQHAGCREERRGEARSSPSRFLLLLSFLFPGGLMVSALPGGGSVVETAVNTPTVRIQEERGSREGAECSHVYV